MPLHTWLTFLVASFLISISPGTAAFAAMSSGAEHGFRRGYWNTVGLQLGLLGQIIFVVAGLGALFAASPAAFAVVKWLGVLYLAYLGLQLWTKTYAARHGPEGVDRRLPRTARSLIRRGLWINVSNPKSFVFLLAVLPQFITTQLPLGPQYAVVTGTMIGMDSLIMAGFTALGARLLTIFRSLERRVWIDRFFGTVFLLLAGFLAMQRRGV